MKTMKLATLFASAAALALAGCGSGENEPDALGTQPGAETAQTDWAVVYPVAGELTPEQQANYDAMDREAVSDEYDANLDRIMVEATPTPGSTATPASGMSAGQSDRQGGSSVNGSGANGSGMPSRGQMDFSYLDRNDDGKLSVAEYAIWAVPANPSSPAPNDEKKPYLTQDEINQAGQSFFYFDADGSTYLSEGEFQNARNSGLSA